MKSSLNLSVPASSKFFQIRGESASATRMSEPELQLDPAIRIWVFLPIVLITFLIGVLRHYVSVLLSSQKKVSFYLLTLSEIVPYTGVFTRLTWLL